MAVSNDYPYQPEGATIQGHPQQSPGPAPTQANDFKHAPGTVVTSVPVVQPVSDGSDCD